MRSRIERGVDARFILARAQGFGAAWDVGRLDLGIATNMPKGRPSHLPSYANMDLRLLYK